MALKCRMSAFISLTRYQNLRQIEPHRFNALVEKYPDFWQRKVIKDLVVFTDDIDEAQNQCFKLFRSRYADLLPYLNLGIGQNGIVASGIWNATEEEIATETGLRNTPPALVPAELAPTFEPLAIEPSSDDAPFDFSLMDVGFDYSSVPETSSGEGDDYVPHIVVQAITPTAPTVEKPEPKKAPARKPAAKKPAPKRRVTSRLPAKKSVEASV